MKKNKISIINLIYMVVIIFGTDSFISYANVDPIPKIIFRIMIYSLILYMLYRWDKKIILNKEGIFIFFAFICIPAAMIINIDFSGGNITKLVFIIFGYLFVRMMDFNKFKILFSNSMLIIAGASIIIYLLSAVLIKIPFLPRISNGGQTIVFVGLSNIAMTSSDGIARNWGPFWEPGVFQAYLILALMFVWKDEKRPFYHKYILIIAILTTFSTTGYICLSLVLITFMIGKNITKLDKKKIIILVIGIIGLGVVVFNKELSEIVFGKFSASSHAYESTRSRFESIYANIYAWKHNPIFGVGITNTVKYVDDYMKSMGYYIYSNTNGLLMNYAAFGVGWGVVYTYSFYLLANRLEQNMIAKIIVFIIFVILLFTEPVLQSLLFNIINFYGFRYKESMVKNESIVVDKCNARGHCKE